MDPKGHWEPRGQGRHAWRARQGQSRARRRTRPGAGARGYWRGGARGRAAGGPVYGQPYDTATWSRCCRRRRHRLWSLFVNDIYS